MIKKFEIKIKKKKREKEEEMIVFKLCLQYSTNKDGYEKGGGGKWKKKLN